MKKIGRQVRVVARAGLFAAAAWLAGCGGEGGSTVKEGPKAPVAGTVTIDGQPLEDGEIAFETVSTAIKQTLPIKGGKFEGQVETGERRVQIYAYRTTKTQGAGGYAPPPSPDSKGPTEQRENYVAPEFNTNSKLTETIPEGGKTDLKYEVKSRSSSPAQVDPSAR